MATTATLTSVPVGPMLSMFDPVYLGIDETGQPVYVRFPGRNMLVAGEPGGGKSGLLNTITAHAVLAENTRRVLFDGKLVELGLWADFADEFVGPDMGHALITMRRLQQVMNNRYAWLWAHGRREIRPDDNVNIIVAVFDEIAYYTATIGTPQQREEFTSLLRDLVARGRAAGIPVIAATQRPSIDIIPKSLRDLFGYRAAFRCTSSGSSNIILGDGWSEAGFSATDIDPLNRGVCYLIAEGGVPKLIKVAYLSDSGIAKIADYADWTRNNHQSTRPISAVPHLRAV